MSSMLLNAVCPSKRARPIARESSRRLAQFADDKDLDINVAGTRETITLPKEAVRILIDLLVQFAQGKAVTLVPQHAELTTQQAADFLGVSRPFVVTQLEAGVIPYQKVGTHRRVRFEDLVAYKQKQLSNRKAALTELTELSQDLNMGY